jgi:hypothetical protein
MSDKGTSEPDYMNGWRWSDLRWQEWTGSDPSKLVLEALRRAVDIRDVKVRGMDLSNRPVMLVDVLNALAESLEVGGSDIWDGTGLWNDPRFGDGYDERAFWERRKRRDE